MIMNGITDNWWQISDDNNNNNDHDDGEDANHDSGDNDDAATFDLDHITVVLAILIQRWWTESWCWCWS